MRIGTFLCWLFGHKFIGVRRYPVKCEFGERGWINHIERLQLPYCIRCGIDKNGASNGQ